MSHGPKPDAETAKLSAGKYLQSRFKDGAPKGSGWSGKIMPLPEGHFTVGNRGFGMKFHPIDHIHKFHGGQDMRGKLGTPILAPEDCVVTDILPHHGGAGNFLKIKGAHYGYGFMHMQNFAKGLKSGMHIKQGQIIGFLGSTGHSTGPHLHFEVYSKAGNKIDPKIAIINKASTITLAEANAVTSGKTTVAALKRDGAKVATAQPVETKPALWRTYSPSA